LALGIICFLYLFLYSDLRSSCFMILAIPFLGTVYNTIWYHRYCSHASFKFKNELFTALFLWTNPLMFREENYAIPHMIHHQLTEKPGDPYGPHLGWLASFLSAELTQRISPKISEEHFTAWQRRIRHIGLRLNTYSQYLKSGCIENARYYWLRTISAHLLWGGFIFASAGLQYVMAWYSAIFITLNLIRDFNWRGHGGNAYRGKKRGWEFDDHTYALNQWFYGFLASEWHDNHHKYPFSASNGFLPGQIDAAFQIIKLMHRIGIVEFYVDSRPIFEKECLASAAKA
jgi:fatty-acid desaturase